MYQQGGIQAATLANKPSSPVDAGMAAIGIGIEKLGKLSEELSVRLATVCRQSPQAVGSAIQSHPEPIRSDLANVLLNKAGQLDGIANRLGVILDSLEL